MQKLEDLDFADDVSLLSHTRGHKQERLHDVARMTGLEINVTKAKSLHVNVSQEGPSPSMARRSRKLIASPTWEVL